VPACRVLGFRNCVRGKLQASFCLSNTPPAFICHSINRVPKFEGMWLVYAQSHATVAKRQSKVFFWYDRQKTEQSKVRYRRQAPWELERFLQPLANLA